MTARRVVLVLTALVVAGLGVVLALVQWERANQIATTASALATVAAVGVAVWAAIPAAGPTLRASKTGKATAGRGGSANTGVTGRAVDLAARIEAEGTGDAHAASDGEANTGVRLT